MDDLGKSPGRQFGVSLPATHLWRTLTKTHWSCLNSARAARAHATQTGHACIVHPTKSSCTVDNAAKEPTSEARPSTQRVEVLPRNPVQVRSGRLPWPQECKKPKKKPKKKQKYWKLQKTSWDGGRKLRRKDTKKLRRRQSKQEWRWLCIVQGDLGPKPTLWKCIAQELPPSNKNHLRSSMICWVVLIVAHVAQSSVAASLESLSPELSKRRQRRTQWQSLGPASSPRPSACTKYIPDWHRMFDKVVSSLSNVPSH